MSMKFAQLDPFSLAGSGVAIGATTILLKSMLDIDGNSLTMADSFGTIGYATLEPGNGANEEQISFTGLTNNANGTVLLTGVKTVLFLSPYTATSGVAKTHAGSTTLIITNTSGFYDKFAVKANDETITGQWTFDIFPITPENTYATTTVAGITRMSVAPASPTVPIAVGDNDGRIPTQNENDALAGTGTPSSSDKYINASTSLSGTAISSSNKVVDQTYLSSATGLPIVRTYLNSGSPATWTKPAGLKYIIVEVQAGGGGGGGTSQDDLSSAGGGGGGYSRKLIAVGTLGATETVTTGAGGTAGANTGGTGGTGGSSSFGAHATATGGAGGTETGNGGAGGIGSSGDVNIKGGGGGGASDWASGGGVVTPSGQGGNSVLGGGAQGGWSSSGSVAGFVGGVYGGGGGGAVSGDGSDTLGGVGGAGIVIVTEYYS